MSASHKAIGDVGLKCLMRNNDFVKLAIALYVTDRASRRENLSEESCIWVLAGDSMGS